MKLFITWCGPIALRVATLLRDWLPKVLPYAEPWVSEEDVAKGSRWSSELWDNLKTAEFGVVCLVPGIASEPWVLFESGALACAHAEDRVAPFLVGLRPQDLPAPLQHFQCTKADKRDVWRLLRSINASSGDLRLPEDKLEQAFRNHWPRLQRHLRRIKATEPVSEETDRPGTETEAAEGSPKPRLDSLSLAILHLLATSIYSSQTAYGIYLATGRPERLIKLRLYDLQRLGLVSGTSTNLDLAYFSTTESGLRLLDERCLLK
jgi:hypothetical protein